MEQAKGKPCNRLFQHMSLAVISVVCISACSTYEPRPSVVPMEDNHTIANTASLSNTYIVDRNSTFIFCSEPAPDAGFTQANSGNVNVSIIDSRDIADSAGESDISSEQQMNGRTPGVLLARELLYRLCEFARNNNLSKDQAIMLYKQNLDLIKSISSIEAGNTKVTISNSVKDTETNQGSGYDKTSTVTNAPAANVTESSISTTAVTGSTQNASGSANTGNAQTGTTSTTGTTQCSNGIDDDGDGDIDTDDAGCPDAAGNDESSA